MTLAGARGSVGGVLLSFSLCWLATASWVLADAPRARRVGLPSLAAHSRRWRALAAALLAAAALPLARGEGLALGLVALLLVLMAVLSLAVLLFPLRPRWYLASVALSGVLALLGLALV